MSGDIERELFERIHADPADDDARLVFADWLLEQGRPEGEFIRIGCEAARRTLLGREKRRVRALLPFEREWLGPVQRATDRASRMYERGFLVECMLSNRFPGACEVSLDHRAWGLVRAVGGASFVPFSELQLLLDHPMLRWLRAVRGLNADTARALLTGPQRPDIETIEVFTLRQAPGLDPSELRSALDRSPSALPGVRHLELHNVPAHEAGWLFGTQTGQRLGTLGVRCDGAELGAWHSVVVEQAASNLRVLSARISSYKGFVVRFSRAGDGSWRDAFVSGISSRDRTLEDLVTALGGVHRGTLSRLTFEVPASFEPFDVRSVADQLRAAVGDDVELIDIPRPPARQPW